MLKICDKCLISKLLNEFYSHKQTKDGLRGTCKVCTNKMAISSYFIHREAHDKRSRMHKKNRIYKSPYELLSEQLRSLRYNCKKRDIRKKAKNLPITISAQDLFKMWDVQNGKCAITGVLMEYQRKSIKTVSIDRKNSDQGYVIDNIQLVTKFVNLGKGIYSNDDVLKILHEIKWPQ